MGDVLELVTDERQKLIDHALEDAHLWSERIDLAKEAYDASIDRCVELGISQTVIARRVGKSEAAIRMHLKRKAKK